MYSNFNIVWSVTVAYRVPTERLFTLCELNNTNT